MKRELLEVLEAARALGLRRTATGVRAEGTAGEFSARLLDLLDAIERFDRAGASTVEPPELRFRRGLEAAMSAAAAAGVDPELLEAAARDAMGPDPWDIADAALEAEGMRPRPAPAAPGVGAPRAAAPTPENTPGGREAAEEAGRALRRVWASSHSLRKATEQLRDAMNSPALSPAVADTALRAIEQIVAAYRPMPRGGLQDTPGLGYDARPGFDPDGYTSGTRADLDTDQIEPVPEDVVDFGAAIDAMADRLLYGVRRVGWSPRLRRLALAWRQAMNEAERVERENDAGLGPHYSIPEPRWRELRQALAELTGPAAHIRVRPAPGAVENAPTAPAYPAPKRF